MPCDGDVEPNNTFAAACRMGLETPLYPGMSWSRALEEVGTISASDRVDIYKVLIGGGQDYTFTVYTAVFQDAEWPYTTQPDLALYVYAGPDYDTLIANCAGGWSKCTGHVWPAETTLKLWYPIHLLGFAKQGAKPMAIKSIIKNAEIGKYTVGGVVPNGDAEPIAAIDKLEIEADVEGGRIVDAVIGIRIESAADLRKELAGIKQLVTAAVEAGEIANPDDAEDATRAIERAAAEASKDKPEGKRMIDNMQKLSEILKNVSEAAPNVKKLLPYIPLVISGARALLGI